MAYNMYHTQLAKAWTQVRLQQQLPGLWLTCHACLHTVASSCSSIRAFKIRMSFLAAYREGKGTAGGVLGQAGHEGAAAAGCIRQCWSTSAAASCHACHDTGRNGKAQQAPKKGAPAASTLWSQQHCQLQQVCVSSRQQ
jgi:hypothetical protein